jgi:hypothetical protein
VALSQPSQFPVPATRSAPAVARAPAVAPDHHLRRCTFRRVSAVQSTKGRRRVLPIYDVECLYPDRATPVPLGDLVSARAICDGCHATGIFRADEG